MKDYLKQLFENAGVNWNDHLLSESTVASDETHNKIMKLGAICTSTMYDDYYTLKNGRRIRISTHPAFNTRSNLNVEYGGSKTGFKTEITDEELKRINELPEVEFKPNFTRLMITGSFKNLDLSDLSNGQLKTIIYTAQQDYTDAWVEAYKRGIIDKETYEKPLLFTLNLFNKSLRSSKRMRNSNPDKQELIHYNEKRIKKVQSLLNISDAPVIKEFKLEETINSLPNENSLGEKIIPDDDPVKLQNFWNWFGNSKVVDEQGRPLVVYHMSDYKFNTFDISKQQGRTWGKGFYFSSDKLGNHLYGENEYVCYLKAKNPYITNFPKTYNEFVKLCNEILNYNNKEELENCFDYYSGFFNQRAVYAFSKIYLELYGADRPNTPYTEKGYDSIIINDSLLGSQGEAHINKEIVVFKPDQIKSVRNSGNFNPTSKNIFESY